MLRWWSGKIGGQVDDQLPMDNEIISRLLKIPGQHF